MRLRLSVSWPYSIIISGSLASVGYLALHGKRDLSASSISSDSEISRTPSIVQNADTESRRITREMADFLEQSPAVLKSLQDRDASDLRIPASQESESEVADTNPGSAPKYTFAGLENGTLIEQWLNLSSQTSPQEMGLSKSAIYGHTLKHSVSVAKDLSQAIPQLNRDDWESRRNALELLSASASAEEARATVKSTIDQEISTLTTGSSHELGAIGSAIPTDYVYSLMDLYVTSESNEADRKVFIQSAIDRFSDPALKQALQERYSAGLNSE